MIDWILEVEDIACAVDNMRFVKVVVFRGNGRRGKEQ